jgi:hypothetical protein
LLILTLTDSYDQSISGVSHAVAGADKTPMSLQPISDYIRPVFIVSSISRLLWYFNQIESRKSHSRFHTKIFRKSQGLGPNFA